ncbi:MAG TPA: serine/threonine-protein kinase [Gemmataceae bacterium]|nr:serine/threonine-protein kinase [Gemmataceae bacterium]
MSEPNPLATLLLRHEELRAQGTPLPPEELCRDCPELAETLKRRIRELESMNALLGDVHSEEASAGGTPSDPGTAGPSVFQPADALCTGSRYEVLRFHAKGGLGEVHVARDEQLHREVALKCLQAPHDRNPHSRSRFLREAEITGRLDHPNIVPVHSMGQDAHGRPFYAMRLIQGQTLHEAIQGFHATGRAHFGGLALRQLLSRFVAVCNTIAYAHSKGIVHRDIKPHNIMLGPYGETLVVDWGLAKEMAAQDSGSMPQATPADTGSPTHTGAVLGTPAYMSPEQAKGDWSRVGPASDIYSLGATLYALLTGQPPFEGEQVGALVSKVKQGAFVRPRERRQEIPRPLEAICLKAMAQEPEWRYATALDMAADLEHWLADEAVSAYREGSAARLARWGRRHRALVTGAAALLLTAVVLLTVGIVLINQEKGRTKSAYAGLQREQDRTNEALAAEARRRAQARDALDLLSSEVIDGWLAQQNQLLPEHSKFLEKALMSYEQLAGDTGEEEASVAGAALAFRRVGNIRWRLGHIAEADAAFLRSRDLWQQLNARFPGVPNYRLELAKIHNNLALLQVATNRSDAAERAHREAMRLFEQLASEFPTVPEYAHFLAWSQTNLADLFHNTNRNGLAEQTYQQALAIRQRLADAHPQVIQYQDKLAESYNRLGDLYRATARAELAKQAFQQTRVIKQRLADTHPELPEYQFALADSCTNLARLHMDAGRTDAAEEGFLQARLIYQRLAETHPQLRGNQRLFAASQINLGVLFSRTARADLAEQAFQQAWVIYQRLVDVYPEIADYTIELGGICWNLGLVLQTLEKPEQALQGYAKGIQPLQALLQKDPRQAKAREVLLNIYGGRAQVLAVLGRNAEAEQELRLAEEVDQGQSLGLISFFGGSDIRQHRACVFALERDHTRATAEAEDLLKAKILKANQLYNLAFVFALAAEAGREDTKLSQSERVRVGDRCAARAVELLRKAHAAGYFRNPAAVAQLHTAKQLMVLRSRPDFQQLVKELEKNE